MPETTPPPEPIENPDRFRGTDGAIYVGGWGMAPAEAGLGKDIAALPPQEKQRLREQMIAESLPLIDELQKATTQLLHYTQQREHRAWTERDEEGHEYLEGLMKEQEGLVSLRMSETMRREGYYVSKTQLEVINNIRAGGAPSDELSRAERVETERYMQKIRAISPQEAQDIEQAAARIDFYQGQPHNGPLPPETRTPEAVSTAREDLARLERNGHFMDQTRHAVQYDARTISARLREQNGQEAPQAAPAGAPALDLNSLLPPAPTPGKRPATQPKR